MSDSENSETNAPIERRESERHPPAVEPTYVWISLDKRLRAKVINESEGGVGLLVEGEGNHLFSVGFQVRVQHQDRRRTATTVYVSEPIPESDGGGFRVGLEWAD